MKNICFILVLFLSTVFLSCKKSDEAGLHGNWKLTETLFDIGNGSGKYTKVTGEAKYLVLSKSGMVGGNATPDFTSFKILDSVKIEFTSKNTREPFIYRYKVFGNSLVLNPPCIEACGLKFVRN